MKQKIIHGKPVYVYRRNNYVEQPRNTIIKKMIVCDGYTYVYCKKRTYYTEIVCLLLCILLAVLNITKIHSGSITFNYNSVINYYDNKLYVNWNLSDNSIVPINVTISGNNMHDVVTLNPGDTLVTLDVTIPDTYYEIEVSYQILDKVFKKNYDIICNIKE